MADPMRCPRCGKLLAFYADAGGYWQCNSPACSNNPATVTTLLDERGRPTNMRGWRRGMTRRAKLAPRPALTIEQILQLEG